MKKFLCLLVLPALAACAGSESADDIVKGPIGLTEESLSERESSGTESTRGTSRRERAERDLIFGGPRYYIGSPYMLDNVQYTPIENFGYSETGIAGIMPVDLDDHSTTNGERVNTRAMIGTSKTLPLPSIVRITNLSNDQSAVIRINNRGPFVNSRFMDVSPAVARRIGMTGQTRVRVEILEEESRKVKELTPGSESPAGGPVSAGPAGTDGTAVMARDASGGVVPMAMSDSSTYVAGGGTGPFTVQAGAYFSQESANGISRQISNVGHSEVIQEGGMFKIQFRGLSPDQARGVIQRLRSEHNLAPGLIRDGRWVNADSI